jgi:hypothetical protein
MNTPSINPDIRDRLREAKRQLRLAVRKYGFQQLHSNPLLRRKVINACVRENGLAQTSLERHFRLFAGSALRGKEKFFL